MTIQALKTLSLSLLSLVLAVALSTITALAGTSGGIGGRITDANTDKPVAVQVAPAQDERQYTDGPVTEEDYIEVEYGHFEEYIDWLNSTWKPTMEAMKKAGLIIDFKVFSATPKSPGEPNVILWITFKNGQAALDNGVELEDVAKKVIGSTEFQNKARQFRNQYRKVLGTELIRELILK